MIKVEESYATEFDKSGRELRHRILVSFFVVEILTTKESVAKLNLQMVIFPQQRKIPSNNC